jgi:hypothetical protein
MPTVEEEEAFTRLSFYFVAIRTLRSGFKVAKPD